MEEGAGDALLPLTCVTRARMAVAYCHPHRNGECNLPGRQSLSTPVPDLLPRPLCKPGRGMFPQH
eukprot:scaffold48546_cov21-Tisochrysis_lutea.AAC.1